MNFKVLSSKKMNLEKFEKEFSFIFPDSYASFLSKHNGISTEEGHIIKRYNPVS